MENKISIPLIIIYFIIYQWSVVCTDQTLIKELLEDIQYNNKLDCKRYIDPKPNETHTESALRIAAQWTSTCAFEADYNWHSHLYSLFFVSDPKLVNSNGIEYNTPWIDNNEEADMCEIVRTLIYKGWFKKPDGTPYLLIDLATNAEDIIYKIRCAAFNQYSTIDETPGICAVSTNAYKQDAWVILLGGEMMDVRVPYSFEEELEMRQKHITESQLSSLDVMLSQIKDAPIKTNKLKNLDYYKATEYKTTIFKCSINEDANLKGRFEDRLVDEV